MNEGRIVVQRGTRHRARRLGQRVPRGAGAVVARPSGSHARRTPLPPWARPPGSPSPPSSCTRRRAPRSSGAAFAGRSPRTRTGASRPGPSSSSTRRPRRSTSSTAYRPPDRHLTDVDRPPRHDGLGDRSAARAAVPPLPRGRARAHRGGPHRAADQPEPGGHRGRPRRLRTDRCSTEPPAIATHRLEQLVRSYDPCISCATHFLDLTTERRP